MPDRWTDDELRACVGSYLTMLSKELAGEKYEKSAVRRHLTKGPLFARSAPSIEWRMRNISAVLEARGKPYIPGYLPAKNTGADVTRRIGAILDELDHEGAGIQLPPMVFFNVGWMERYQGMSPDDPTLGRHGYLANHDHGHESFNFLAEGGRVFGYQPRGNKLWLPRLGGSPRNDSLDHVLVVWLATHPKTMKVMIVGWYSDATVYRTQRPRVPKRGVGAGTVEIFYTAEAAANNAKLLPVGNREFEAPTHHSMTGGLGQSPVWYGGNDAFRWRVWRYIQGVERNLKLPNPSPSKRKGGSLPRNHNSELRRKVEKIAVDHATAFFESKAGGSYSIESVELEGRGWDLEATRGREKLLIEVKGLSGTGAVCEFTPNEYAKAHHDDHRNSYVIYIVTGCLSDNPVASIFRFTAKGAWEAADGRCLSVVPLTGARLTIVEAVSSID
ncbi:MAG: DUF3883 domain-containing protein [Mesorhizobium sp.]|nr:MAG: DUF3883 domain-containing protein [Mesorhizobium sp.]